MSESKSIRLNTLNKEEESHRQYSTRIRFLYRTMVSTEIDHYQFYFHAQVSNVSQGEFLQHAIFFLVFIESIFKFISR